MKCSLVLALFLTLIFSVIAFGQDRDINIIPQPSRIGIQQGAFIISNKTRIVATDEVGRRNAEIFANVLQSSIGIRPKITSKRQTSNEIVFISVTGVEQERNLYLLNIEPKSIRISGDERSQFYAVQSLRQMIPSGIRGPVSIPAARIVDTPRFPYRGMHLDTARHFMPVEFVKKYIDLMSQYKFDYFHWHLTDDQGWRIEIKKYPKLTEIGSKRSETHVGRYTPEFKGDGIPVEGFYTQEQIKDVVAYAKARYITVVPEIELPGHASAALAAYPKFGCKADYKYEVKKTWGIFKEVFCPSEETFKFLEDVIDETLPLFPDSPYIHIGGDEVLKDHWKESPFVQDLMKRENLKDEHEVQSYFIRRMEKFINSRGKKIIGWDEILEGGLAPNATVMSWRGMKGGIEAAKSKHDVIMTPTDYAYLDYGQGDPATEPLNIGGYLPLEKVYSFDPVPKELTNEESGFIIGGQANIWTEYLKKPENVEYMAFPRMLAISEVLWTQPTNKSFDDFQSRLYEHYQRLDDQKVNYRIPPPSGLENAVVGKDEQYFTILRPTVDGSTIYYTVDGSTPTTKSRSDIRHAQISLDPNGSDKQEIKALIQLPNGRLSSVFTATILRKLWRAPEPDLKEKRAGVTFGFVMPPTGDNIEPTITSGETRSIGLTQFAKTADLKQNFAASFDGYFSASVDAIYEFEVTSTWDTTILIGGEKLIDDSGTAERKTRTALIPLRAGLHKISLRYNHRGGDPFWRVRWAIKGQNWRNWGGGELVH